METMLKEQYEAPAMQVVEVKMEGVICGSDVQTMMFTLSGEILSSEEEWSRSDYGSSVEF